ncbi:Nuclear pore glycoprotein p62 [Anthophora quadrimaculata]
MNFTFNATKPQVSTTQAGGTPTTTFTFGTSGAGDAPKPTGFSLTSTPVQGKPGGVFSTGLSTPVQSTGFSFGTPASTPANTAPSQPPGLTFGTGTVATTGITPAVTSTVAPTGFSVPTPAARGGEAAVSTPTTGLTFGTPSTMATGTGFSLSATPAATTTGTTTTATTTGFSINASGTTSAATRFTFGTGTTATSTTGFSLNQTAATPSLTSTQASLGTTTTVTSSAGTLQPASISSFEDSINKWTLELEEQEKVFVNQAAQVNAWDKLLIANGEKIVALNQEVERVKIEQQQLEHELDYVVGQQKELQDCLVPLEKELASLSVSDPEREYTYRLAEDLDTQLKRMSEDLKEIIEHLNEANRTQDSSDPIVQIGKILNAHMNSLQWLDQQTSLLSHKIQQIDQMHQNFRQENERSFSLAYN